jgi:hypothetical protein
LAPRPKTRSALVSAEVRSGSAQPLSGPSVTPAVTTSVTQSVTPSVPAAEEGAP